MGVFDFSNTKANQLIRPKSYFNVVVVPNKTKVELPSHIKWTPINYTTKN